MALTEKQITLVQTSFTKVAPISEQASKLFYNRLFEIAPETQELFSDADMVAQRRKLMQTLGTAVGALKNLETLVPAVKDLGKRHIGYDVTADQYQYVGDALLWTLEQGLGDDFDEETRAAWTAVYNLLAATAIEGAQEVEEDYGQESSS